MSANYTVMVQRTGEVGRIMDLKLEYFVILTVCVLCMFIISVLCIVLVCAVVTKRTLLKHQKSPPRPAPMPCKIKMGTCSTRVVDYRGPDTCNPSVLLDYRAPDILSDVSHVYQNKRYRQ